MTASKTTPNPLPTPLAMSTAPSDPTPTPLPVRTSSLAPRVRSEKDATESKEDKVSRPHPKPTYPSPLLRLECRDLGHPGADTFFKHKVPTTALENAVGSVLSTLYSPTKTNNNIPPTRSVTLILRPMDGVAYTTGKDIDDDHKEIHFSLDYINSIKSGREADEIQGVLVHEMVHAWQWNASGSAPGGLIEGIADFVRLKADLSPPHWTKDGSGDWDAGYQHTGYFLDWIEEKWGPGSVRRINDGLKGEKYEEEVFWTDLFGKKVQELWEEYQANLEKEKKKVEEGKRRATSEDGFWQWVKEKNGAEKTIVLKAIWRTGKHRKEPSRDSLAQEVEGLWTEYLERTRQGE